MLAVIVAAVLAGLPPVRQLCAPLFAVGNAGFIRSARQGIFLRLARLFRFCYPAHVAPLVLYRLNEYASKYIPQFYLSSESADFLKILHRGQFSLNQWVVGSSPSASTIKKGPEIG